MEHEGTSRWPSLSEFTNTFVPFALLLSAALMTPELPQVLERLRSVYTLDGLVLLRAIYSIWVTIVFLTAAVVLHFAPGESERKQSYWRLCWTFGFLAYCVHFYYTVGVAFHGSLREVYAKQGVVIASSNLLDTVWWAFDAGLAWLVRTPARWIRVQRTVVHLYIPMTFFMSAVVIKHGVVRGLGIAMTVAILLSIGCRILVRLQGPMSPPRDVRVGTAARSSSLE